MMLCWSADTEMLASDKHTCSVNTQNLMQRQIQAAKHLSLNKRLRWACNIRAV